MFWGLNLKANRKYSQTTSKSFHISQAALDATTSDDGPNQIFITCEDQRFLLCTLRKGVCEQVMLDYNFAEGDKIAFQCKGNGSVSLTGYIVENDMLDYMNGDEEDSELDEEQEQDLRAALEQKKLKKATKGKAVKGGEDAEGDDDDDEEEDEDDDEFDEEGDEDEMGEDDDEDDDDDDEEEEDDDDEEDDEDEDDEIEQPQQKKAKIEKQHKQQNGVAKETAPAAANEKKNKKEKQREKQEQQQKQQPQQQKQQTLAGGVKIEDIRVGSGPEVKVGKRAQVYYEGRLKSNNKVFDSLKNGAGFKFSVGKGEVIKGWDVGLVGMKVGGKRRITCPPHMAYGARGSPPTIPPNSTLVFEVELKGVN